MADTLDDLVTPGLDKVPEGAIQISGYLSKDSGGRFRLHPTLEDLSQYVEFAAGEAVAWVRSSPTSHRVTVWFQSDTKLKHVRTQKAEARFLSGSLARDNMLRAARSTRGAAQLFARRFTPTHTGEAPCPLPACAHPSTDIDVSLNDDCY